MDTIDCIPEKKNLPDRKWNKQSQKTKERLPGGPVPKHHASIAEGNGSTPAKGTRSHMATTKSLNAVTNRHSQINK